MTISLNARIVESLFLMPDGRTDGGWRKVCEQVDNYGQINMNTQTGEAVMGPMVHAGSGAAGRRNVLGCPVCPREHVGKRRSAQ